MKNLKIVLLVLAIIVGIDFAGFLFWGMSGQVPMDNFFIGTMTYHTLQAIIF